MYNNMSLIKKKDILGVYKYITLMNIPLPFKIAREMDMISTHLAYRILKTYGFQRGVVLKEYVPKHHDLNDTYKKVYKGLRTTSQKIFVLVTPNVDNDNAMTVVGIGSYSQISPSVTLHVHVDKEELRIMIVGYMALKYALVLRSKINPREAMVIKEGKNVLDFKTVEHVTRWIYDNISLELRTTSYDICNVAGGGRMTRNSYGGRYLKNTTNGPRCMSGIANKFQYLPYEHDDHYSSISLAFLNTIQHNEQDSIRVKDNDSDSYNTFVVDDTYIVKVYHDTSAYVKKMESMSKNYHYHHVNEDSWYFLFRIPQSIPKDMYIEIISKSEELAWGGKNFNHAEYAYKSVSLDNEIIEIFRTSTGTLGDIYLVNKFLDDTKNRKYKQIDLRTDQKYHVWTFVLNENEYDTTFDKHDDEDEDTDGDDHVHLRDGDDTTAVQIKRVENKYFDDKLLANILVIDKQKTYAYKSGRKSNVNVCKFQYNTDFFVEIYRATKKEALSYLMLVKKITTQMLPDTMYYMNTDKNVLILCTQNRGITLTKYWLSKSTISDVTIYNNIIKSIESCHAKGITHGDITFDNIIIDVHSNDISLIDFEFSTYDTDFQDLDYMGLFTQMITHTIRAPVNMIAKNKTIEKTSPQFAKNIEKILKTYAREMIGKQLPSNFPNRVHNGNQMRLERENEYMTTYNLITEEDSTS